MITSEELAERIKTDIVALVKAGTIPETVANFAHLDDYVDANCLGGGEAIFEAVTASAVGGTVDDHIAALNRHADLVNPATEIVDLWIAEGGVKGSV